MMGRPRIRNFDQRFFGVIDTEAKAYWLGMLTADGWVELRNYCTGLSLKDEDREHVVRFLRDVGSAKDPVRKPRREGRLSWAAQLYSKTMFQSLLRYGLVPSKSLIATPADHLIPESLRRHYWRGLLDGDGTIGNSRRADNSVAWTVGVCGTEAVCRGFLSFIHDAGVLGGSLVRHKNHAHPFYAATFHGCALPSRVVQLLYHGATVALARKERLATELASGEHRSRWREWPTREELDAMLEQHGSWPMVAASLNTSTGGLWRVRKQLGYPVKTYPETRGRRGKPASSATPHELEAAL